MNKEDRKDHLQKAKDILNEHKDQLQKCNILGSSVGFKRKQGKFTDEIVMILYVKKKMTKEELAQEDINPIPEEIEGMPTDIVEIPAGFTPRNSSSNNTSDQ